MYEWQKRENERLLAKFETDATVDAHGVVRWDSNKRIPPQDVLQLWAENGKPINLDLCMEERAEETAAFLREYREAALNAPRNPEVERERMFEMRAAFGPNATVVNIVTGEKYNT